MALPPTSETLKEKALNIFGAKSFQLSNKNVEKACLNNFKKTYGYLIVLCSAFPLCGLLFSILGHVTTVNSHLVICT